MQKMRLVRREAARYHAPFRLLSTARGGPKVGPVRVHHLSGSNFAEPFRIKQDSKLWVEDIESKSLVKQKLQKEEPGAPPSLSLSNLMSSEAWLTHLMPRDYKTTTMPTYENYAKTTMVSSMLGTAASVLSMQAMLSSVGVAASAALPLAATINWVLKDGLGQLGGVLFASYVNTRFDADPKRFRFGADACLAVSVVLESCTALAPWLFLPVASVANVGKNAAWLSASATRASIHQSFCLEHNLADVTGKAGSQTITASLIGTALGIGLSPLVGFDAKWLVVSTTVLSALHLTASYGALHYVQLRNLNIQRTWLCLSPALVSFRFKDTQSSLCALDWERLDTPSNVAKKERIMHLGKWGSQDGRARLASPPTHVTDDDQHITSPLMSMFATSMTIQPYLKSSIHVNPPADQLNPSVLRNHLLPTCDAFEDQHLVQVIPAPGAGSFVVQLFYLDHASPADVLAGFLHASLVIRALGRLSNVGVSSDSEFYQLCYEVRDLMHKENACAKFYYGIQDKGWDIKHIFIEDKKENRLSIERSSKSSSQNQAGSMKSSNR